MNLQLDEKQPLTPNVYVEYYCNKSIFYIYSNGAHREDVDSFFDATREYFDQRIGQKAPILYLYEIGNVSLTNYSRQRGDQFFQEYVHVKGRGGMILSGGMLAVIIKHYILATHRRKWKGMEIKEFSDKTIGLSWLSEWIPQSSQE